MGNFFGMEDKATRYYEPLLGYVKSRVGNMHDAEDIVQDVFLKISKSDLNAVANLKSWIYKITKNTLIDYYRRKQLEITDLKDHYEEEVKDEETAIEQLSQCVLPFIERLPNEYASLLKLSEIEGLSQKEIAQQLNMNYVTVRSRIRRGRNKLRAIFEECCHVQLCRRGGIMDYKDSSNCC